MDGAKVIVDTVRSLCKESSDSRLAEAALVMATAYEETNAALERILGEIEVELAEPHVGVECPECGVKSPGRHATECPVGVAFE